MNGFFCKTAQFCCSCPDSDSVKGGIDLLEKFSLGVASTFGVQLGGGGWVIHVAMRILS